MRLRILHVSPYSEGAWAYGGIPRVVAALTHGLVAHGHSVTVCTTDVCDDSHRLARNFAESSPTDGLIRVVFPNLSNRLAYRQQAFLPFGLRRFLRDHAGDFDVAHLHACRNLPGAFAAYYLRRAGVPFVLQPNGTAPIIERRLAAKRAFDLLAGQRVLTNASRIVAVSPAEYGQLIDAGVPPESVRVIPNPIDLNEFAEPAVRGSFRRQWGIDRESVVLFLGKITPRKNVDVLVRAFAQLSQPNAKLVIAGNDMGGGARARALASELKVDDRVIFTGLLPGSGRIHALADADVVVYPSEHEIFGLVPFEALLAGTPVVVAGDSGCGNLVGAAGGGAVVPVNDVTALARAIDGVLAQPAKWRMSARRAQQVIRSSYGTDVVCAELENVYQELVTARQENRDGLNAVSCRRQLFA